MPIHPIGVEGKKGSLGCPYANRDYRDVNPEYGTMEDFKKLVEEIHRRDMKCIIDVVYNHTSPDAVLLQEHPEFYYHDENGSTGNKIGDWSDVIDLDYDVPGLWDYQIETLMGWARVVDGFRCDVASFVPVSFWTMDEPAITANTPVLLKTKTTETNFLFKSDIIEDMPVAEGKNFNLVGSYAASMTIDKGDYFLNDNTLYKSAGETTLKGTRAYLKAKTEEARIANIVFDDEEGVVTGITEIATEKASERIYNLSGQKVNAMQRKGLYIKDGKKVMK